MTLRLTRTQVREIDRRATAEYGIPSIVLMENAARSAAEVAMEMLKGVNDPTVQIMCGNGNNGGDGFAIARHLHNRGARVQVAGDWTKPMSSDGTINFRAIHAIPQIERITFQEVDVFDGYDLAIDALFGTGLSRAISGELSKAIGKLQLMLYPILSIDLPSGLDCDTGEPLGPCVHATKTITFVAEKAGFANPRSREFTGEIVIGDIGVPPELIAAVVAESA